MTTEHVPGDQSLLRLLRTGDEEAARALYERYGERLLALARRRISQRFSRRVDPEDIVQSVFRTFFGRAKAGQFRVDDPDDMCKLLARITVHKTLRQIAFHQAGKRDIAMEAGDVEMASSRLKGLLGQEPTPEATGVFLDELEHFLAELRPQERQIIDLRLQGYNNQEIAERLQVTDRTIRRLMERVRGLAAREDWAS